MLLIMLLLLSRPEPVVTEEVEDGKLIRCEETLTKVTCYWKK